MNVGFMWAEVELPARKVAWIPRIPGYSGIFRDKHFFWRGRVRSLSQQISTSINVLIFCALKGRLFFDNPVGSQWSVVSGQWSVAG